MRGHFNFVTRTLLKCFSPLSDSSRHRFPDGGDSHHRVARKARNMNATFEANGHGGLTTRQKSFLDIGDEAGELRRLTTSSRRPRSQKKPSASPQVHVESLAIAEMMGEQFRSLEARLAAMEVLLRDLHERLTVGAMVKEYYTTQEVAKRLGKRPYTVREWCRLGRVQGEKSHSGRGLDDEWRISHAELTRIENEGLLPLTQNARVKAPGRLAK